MVTRHPQRHAPASPRPPAPPTDRPAHPVPGCTTGSSCGVMVFSPPLSWQTRSRQPGFNLMPAASSAPRAADAQRRVASRAGPAVVRPTGVVPASRGPSNAKWCRPQGPARGMVRAGQRPGVAGRARRCSAPWPGCTGCSTGPGSTASSVPRCWRAITWSMQCRTPIGTSGCRQYSHAAARPQADGVAGADRHHVRAAPPPARAPAARSDSSALACRIDQQVAGRDQLLELAPFLDRERAQLRLLAQRVAPRLLGRRHGPSASSSPGVLGRQVAVGRSLAAGRGVRRPCGYVAVLTPPRHRRSGRPD